MKKLLLLAYSLVPAITVLGQNQIAVDLTTDQYGSETIWQIDGAGGGFFENGSGFPDQDAPGSYPQPTEFVDLTDGVFSFCLGDAYDDGFCCAYGQGSITITHVASGTVLFHNDSFDDDIICTTLIMPFSRVQGSLFLDDDHDCAPGAGETRVPMQIIRVLPGPYYGLTDSLGQFDIAVPYGTYTVGAVSTGLSPICPSVQPVPAVVSASEPFAQVMLGDSSVAKLDLVATVASGPARPGFQVMHALNIVNASTFVSGLITATATLDPLLTYLDAAPPPQSVVGNVLTWNLPALGDFDLNSIQLHSLLPPDPDLIGLEIAVGLTAYQTLQEPVLSNNVFTAFTPITGSFDPNDKLVWPRDIYDLEADTVLSYTIRFQNTGTDTAFTVVVTDTLAEELDITSFELCASSHPYALRIDAQNVLVWTFDDIMLPDSNVNEPASHGFLSFRIRPQAPVLPGTVLSNNADIFFDFNPPVRTNDALVVAEFSTGQEQVQRQGRLILFPNPVTSELTITFPTGQPLPSHVEFIAADGRITRLLNGRDGTFDASSLAPGPYTVRANGLLGRFVKW